MEIDRKELKHRAREAVGLSVPHARVVTLVYLLMGVVPSLLLGLFNVIAYPDSSSMILVTVFFSILIALYNCVVRFGYALWSLWTSRRLAPGLGALLDGFSVAGRVLWMEVIIAVRFLLLCIPLILLFALVMALLGVIAISPILAVPLAIVGTLGLYFAIFLLYLRYSLAPYCLADYPDQGAAAAVRRSIQLMRGWLMEFFKLQLSFLGWFILLVLLQLTGIAISMWHSGTFQVWTFSAPNNPQLIAQAIQTPWATILAVVISLPVYLWLIPYYQVTMAGFYDARIELQRQSEPVPPAV